MSENPSSEDKKVDVIDFVINVLKEHEKNMDVLLGRLEPIAAKMTMPQGTNPKIDKIEEGLNALKNEIDKLINSVSNRPTCEAPQESVANSINNVMQGPPVILQFDQWEDFQMMAFQAQTLSLAIKETEKTFQVGALKGNQILGYTGKLPRYATLLKLWLSKQLDVSENRVLENLIIRSRSTPATAAVTPKITQSKQSTHPKEKSSDLPT
jgi:hypothetical protein